MKRLLVCWTVLAFMAFLTPAGAQDPGFEAADKLYQWRDHEQAAIAERQHEAERRIGDEEEAFHRDLDARTERRRQELEETARKEREQRHRRYEAARADIMAVRERLEEALRKVDAKEAALEANLDREMERLERRIGQALEKIEEEAHKARIQAKHRFEAARKKFRDDAEGARKKLHGTFEMKRAAMKKLDGEKAGKPKKSSPNKAARKAKARKKTEARKKAEARKKVEARKKARAEAATTRKARRSEWPSEKGTKRQVERGRDERKTPPATAPSHAVPLKARAGKADAGTSAPRTLAVPVRSAKDPRAASAGASRPAVPKRAVPDRRGRLEEKLDERKGASSERRKRAEALRRKRGEAF